MQNYISHNDNKERIERLKQALVNLEAWAIVEASERIPTTGFVEPYFGLSYKTLWGSLGWLSSWFIRPIFKKVKSLLDYSLIRQSNRYKYRRRGSLGKLFALQTNQDYALFLPSVSHIETKSWDDYIRVYLQRREANRSVVEINPKSIARPTDKELEDLLLLASRFTLSKPKSESSYN